MQFNEEVSAMSKRLVYSIIPAFVHQVGYSKITALGEAFALISFYPSRSSSSCSSLTAKCSSVGRVLFVRK